MDKDFPKMVMFKFYFYQCILWFKFESFYRFAGFGFYPFKSSPGQSVTECVGAVYNTIKALFDKSVGAKWNAHVRLSSLI